MNVNEKILQLRKASGMTQEQLAENMNVSRQAISKWEVGESNPDTDKIVLLSKIFNVSIDYLLIDDITEDKKPLEPIKKDFSKKIAVCCGITLLLIGVAIGYNLHKPSPVDENLLISSQLSGINNLVADFGFSPIPDDMNLGETRPYQFTVVPKVYIEDMTATFMIVSDDGRSITKEATLGNGTVFSAEIEIPYLYNSFNVTVIFSDGYGKYTQGVMKNVKLHEDGYGWESIWNNNDM